MKTLEIKLPDEIFGALSTIAKQQDKFVVEAIKEKIEREKKHSLLVEGYQATFQEDSALAKEYEKADLENL
jgi:predicted transcriptional regulator